MSYFDRFKGGKYKGKSLPAKIWYFIWHEDSIESWLINIVLAFLLIKLIVYPGLGLILGTSHPIVAVVSGSMEHRHLGRDTGSCGYSNKWSAGFDQYWEECGGWYEDRNINKDDFRHFPMYNGFNKGDIMVLFGREPGKINIGDIIVFQSQRPDPIIHRVIDKRNIDGNYYFTTKGDHNKDSYRFESEIVQSQIIGKAFIRVPYLGYVKILAVEFACMFNNFDFCIKG